MPCYEGYKPVQNEARAGEHTGQGVKAFRITAPVPASCVMLGAMISEFP